MKKCKHCGSVGRVDKTGREYNTCKECFAKLCSKRNYNNHLKDPTLKERMRISTIKTYKDHPEIKQKISKGVLAIHEERPELKQQMSDFQLNRYKDPNERLKTSLAMKKAYKNPQYKKNISIGVINSNKRLEVINNRKNAMYKLSKDKVYLKSLSVAQFKRWTKEERIRMRNIHLKRYKDNPNARKIQSINNIKRYKDPDARRITREATLKYINKHILYGQVRPQMGKNETNILNGIEKKTGFKILRQETFIGYFVDGYDFINNIIYEVDEKFHINQTEKDDRRELELIQYLGCEFIRIKDY